MVKLTIEYKEELKQYLETISWSDLPYRYIYDSDSSTISVHDNAMLALVLQDVKKGQKEGYLTEEEVENFYKRIENIGDEIFCDEADKQIVLYSSKIYHVEKVKQLMTEYILKEIALTIEEYNKSIKRLLYMSDHLYDADKIEEWIVE